MTKCFSGLTIFYVMLRNDSYPRNKINPLGFGIWRFHFDRNVLWFWQNTFCCKITSGKIWGWANKGVGEVALLRGGELTMGRNLHKPLVTHFDFLKSCNELHDVLNSLWANFHKVLYSLKADIFRSRESKSWWAIVLILSAMNHSHSSFSHSFSHSSMESCLNQSKHHIF